MPTLSISYYCPLFTYCPLLSISYYCLPFTCCPLLLLPTICILPTPLNLLLLPAIYTLPTPLNLLLLPAVYTRCLPTLIYYYCPINTSPAPISKKCTTLKYHNNPSPKPTTTRVLEYIGHKNAKVLCRHIPHARRPLNPPFSSGPLVDSTPPPPPPPLPRLKFFFFFLGRTLFEVTRYTFDWMVFSHVYCRGARTIRFPRKPLASCPQTVTPNIHIGKGPHCGHIVVTHIRSLLT